MKKPVLFPGENANKAQLSYYDLNTSDYEKDKIFKRTLNRAYERKANIVSKSLGNRPLNKIIEIGAGSGLMTYFLSKQLNVKNYVALDLSEAMLDLARARIKSANITFQLGDARSLPFPMNEFDAVVGVDIIHHLSEPVSALKEWLRIVRPGGQLVFLESNALNPLNMLNIGVEHEVRSFLNTDTNLLKWTREAGWGNVRVLPAPSYTPAGPTILHPVLNLIDHISPSIPLWKKMTALWLISGTK